MKQKTQKNILFFQNSILPSEGGVPRVSDIVSSELSKRGYNCYFAYYLNDNPNYDHNIKIKIHKSKITKSAEALILRFILEKEINIFICQNAYSPSFIKLYKRIIKQLPTSTFITFLHASPDYWKNTYSLKSDKLNHKKIKNTIKKFAKRLVFPIYNPYVLNTSALYSLSSQFVLLSQSFENTFLQLYVKKGEANKLTFIPNPLTYYGYIDVEDVYKKEKIVLVVSRLEETQKKIYTILKIWEHLGTKSQDWKLKIIGSGPDEQFYRKYAKTNNLKNVNFLGLQENLINHYRSASIFMMASIWEGFPMSLLEGQQNGVVPIAFDNFSAIHDIISDGQNGFVISDNNVELFSERLFYLMENETQRIEMSKSAITSSKQFHVSKIADKWEALFQHERQTI